MDRTYAEETKRQHRKKSSPVEPSRTKEERQTKEWSRGVKQEMKEAEVTWGSLEAAAQDRVKWKQFIGGLCSTSGVTKA